MPAARLIKCEIVRFADQQRELDGFMIAHGLDRRVECDAGIAAAATVGAGRDAADATDMKLAPVPGPATEADPDMTAQPALARADQLAQVGTGPFDVAP